MNKLVEIRIDPEAWTRQFPPAIRLRLRLHVSMNAVFPAVFGSQLQPRSYSLIDFPSQ